MVIPACWGCCCCCCCCEVAVDEPLGAWEKTPCCCPGAFWLWALVELAPAVQPLVLPQPVLTGEGPIPVPKVVCEVVVNWYAPPEETGWFGSILEDVGKPEERGWVGTIVVETVVMTPLLGTWFDEVMLMPGCMLRLMSGCTSTCCEKQPSLEHYYFGEVWPHKRNRWSSEP